MRDLLNSISVLSTFVAIVGIIYFMLYNTVGKLNPAINGHIVITNSVKKIILLVISISVVITLLALKCIQFYKPW